MENRRDKNGRDKDPRLAGDILREVRREIGIDPGGVQQRIVAVWPEVAGEEIAGHTRPGILRKGVLSVAVESAPLYYELTSFSGEDIRKKINEKLGSAIIHKINFHMNGL